MSEPENAPDLALPFDTDDPEFTRGAEVGIAWAHLQLEGIYEGHMHVTNTEMAIRLAEAVDLPFRAEAAGDDFVYVVIGGAE